jgi:hypothetical protein
MILLIYAIFRGLDKILAPSTTGPSLPAQPPSKWLRALQIFLFIHLLCSSILLPILTLILKPKVYELLTPLDSGSPITTGDMVDVSEVSVGIWVLLMSIFSGVLAGGVVGAWGIRWLCRKTWDQMDILRTVGV